MIRPRDLFYESEQLVSLLSTLNMIYDRFDHPPIFHVNEAIKLRGHVEGAYVKNLFLRDRDSHYYLIVIKSDRVLDLQKLRAKISCRRLSFASETELWDVLRVRPGSVSPLALVNAQPKTVRVLIDQYLAQVNRVNFHPLVNTVTLLMDTEKWTHMVQEWGHFIEWIDVSDLQRD